MAKLLTRRAKAVNPAGGSNPAQEPNVGQYGWTKAEASHILRILEFVNVSKKYSEESKAAATYTREIAEVATDAMNGAVQAQKDAQAANDKGQLILDENKVLGNTVSDKEASVTRMYDELKALYPDLAPVLSRINDLERRVSDLEAKP